MANAPEHVIDYPFGDQLPAPGQVLDVAPGVRWTRMPLPFALDHINLWLLADRDADGREGWAIVDCGIDNADTRGAWEQVFATGLDGKPVLRVIVTHMHPDHIGLAHWLTTRWNCRLWISAADWNAARFASQATTGFGGEHSAEFFRSHGLTDPEALAKVRARGSYFSPMVPEVPRQHRRMMDGQTVTTAGGDWRCIVGHGHSPEHISLHDAAAGVLISGDMLLPRISTNVSVTDLEPEGDPLPLYLRSIDALSALPAGTLVLPSHGKPFRGMRGRIEQLQQHHVDRLADTLAACRQAPTSAADLLPVLFKRTLDLHQTTFAMGEAVAHLHALLGRGEVVRTEGEDGVWRFSTP